MTRNDVALLDDEGDVAALVTITPMDPGDDAAEIAADASDLLAEEFDVAQTPVEVGRDA